MPFQKDKRRPLDLHKKLGDVPDGGGWRYVGRAHRQNNRTSTYVAQRKTKRPAKVGTAYIHTVLDDHSRVGYDEIHDATRKPGRRRECSAGRRSYSVHLHGRSTRTVHQELERGVNR